jgi:hypothetical protein
MAPAWLPGITTQLNRVEGWRVYASPDGLAFTPLGTFNAFNASNAGRAAVDIDLNGTAVPLGAQYLRFVGTTVPPDGVAHGFDFDAVGVQA